MPPFFFGASGMARSAILGAVQIHVVVIGVLNDTEENTSLPGRQSLGVGHWTISGGTGRGLRGGTVASEIAV